MRWRFVSWLLVGAALIAVVAPLAAGWRWRQQSTRLRDRLDRAPAPAGVFSGDRLAGLPAPVVRYLRQAIPEGHPLIRTADIDQEGQFRTAAGDDSWRPFTATQRFASDPPGFVWDARIRMAPLIPVLVRDAFAGGTGSMQASVLGLVPLVDQAGGAELSAGALTRYLAEAMWFPTRLLPGRGLSWAPVSDRAAAASLTVGAMTVSIEFRFDAHDDVVALYAPGRFREVDGRFERTPWRARCTDHQARDGLRLPLSCEVEWQLPDGPWPYWRGRVTAVRYRYAH